MTNGLFSPLFPFLSDQVVVGTAISYGAAINANFGTPIIGEIPKGFVIYLVVC